MRAAYIRHKAFLHEKPSDPQSSCFPKADVSIQASTRRVSPISSRPSHLGGCFAGGHGGGSGGSAFAVGGDLRRNHKKRPFGGVCVSIVFPKAGKEVVFDVGNTRNCNKIANNIATREWGSTNECEWVWIGMNEYREMNEIEWVTHSCRLLLVDFLSVRMLWPVLVKALPQALHVICIWFLYHIGDYLPRLFFTPIASILCTCYDSRCPAEKKSPRLGRGLFLGNLSSSGCPIYLKLI